MSGCCRSPTATAPSGTGNRRFTTRAGDAAAARRDGRRTDLSGRLRRRPPASAGGRMTAEDTLMPVTVKTFATSGEAAAALSSERDARYLGGGTLVMRALNEGDVVGLDHRAGRRTAPCATRRHAAPASRSAPASPWRAFSPSATSPFCIRSRALDRRPGGAQHGHRRRQSVRAGAVRRFRRRAAGARRHGRGAGRLRRARDADRGVPGAGATAHAGGARALGLVASAPPAPRRFATARSRASSRRAPR